MKWTAGNRDNVDDVRGQTGGGGAVRMGGLGIGGLLPAPSLGRLAIADAEARYVAAGDDAIACHRSVRNGWRTFVRPA